MCGSMSLSRAAPLCFQNAKQQRQLLTSKALLKLHLFMHCIVVVLKTASIVRDSSALASEMDEFKCILYYLLYFYLSTISVTFAGQRY